MSGKVRTPIREFQRSFTCSTQSYLDKNGEKVWCLVATCTFCGNIIALIGKYKKPIRKERTRKMREHLKLCQNWHNNL